MAQAIPLITAATTVASAGLAFKQGKDAKKSADAAAKKEEDANKLQFDKQTKDLNEEQKQAGARRRIANLRNDGKSPTLFSNSGFSGAPKTLAG